MFITAADENNIMSVHPEESHEDVRRKVNAGHMPEMQGTIGIRQGCGDSKTGFRHVGILIALNKDID